MMQKPGHEQTPANKQSEAKDTGKDLLQEPAEGDRATIDRELARKDGGNVAHEDTGTAHDDGQDKSLGESRHATPDVHDTVKAAMDEAAPQTGVRPGP
jgi:hypothetical protein